MKDKIYHLIRLDWYHKITLIVSEVNENRYVVEKIVKNHPYKNYSLYEGVMFSKSDTDISVLATDSSLDGIMEHAILEVL